MGVVWAGLVFIHYYSWSSLADFAFLKTLAADLKRGTDFRFQSNGLSFLKNLLLTLNIWLTLWMWGRRFRKWLGLSLGNRAIKISAEFALGVAGANALWLGTGLSHLWFQILLFPLALAAWGTALFDFFFTLMDRPALKPAFPKEIPLRLLFLLGILSGLFSLAQGAIPEVYFDSLAYHLSTLSYWIFHHGISDFPTNLYSYYPFGGELYFLNGLFFQGTEAAKTLNALAAGACLMAAAGWVTEMAGASSGFLVFGMIAAFPLVSTTVWTTQIDVLLCFYLILFFYALTRWVKRDPRWAIAAALFGGTALTMKYTAIIGVLAGLAVLGLFLKTRGRKRSFPSGWILLVAMIAGALIPWFLKNYLYSGNPFYPYLSLLFGGKSLPPVNHQALMGDHASVWGSGESFGRWFQLIFIRDLAQSIAPLLFSFLPFLFFRFSLSEPIRKLAILSVLYLGMSFGISHQLRLAMPAILLCLMTMVFVLSEIKKKPVLRTWTLISLLFGLIGFLSLCRLSSVYYQSQKIWFGEELHSEFLAHSPLADSYYGLTEACARLLPPEGRVLVAGDGRGLYYRQPFLTNSAFDEQALASLARRERSGDGIYLGLKKMGVDALAVSGQEGIRLSRNYPYVYSLTLEEWDRLDDFIQRYCDLCYFEGSNGIYRVRVAPAKRKIRIPDLLLLFRKG